MYIPVWPGLGTEKQGQAKAMDHSVQSIHQWNKHALHAKCVCVFLTFSVVSVFVSAMKVESAVTFFHSDWVKCVPCCC